MLLIQDDSNLYTDFKPKRRDFKGSMEQVSIGEEFVEDLIAISRQAMSQLWEAMVIILKYFTSTTPS